MKVPLQDCCDTIVEEDHGAAAAGHRHRARVAGEDRSGAARAEADRGGGDPDHLHAAGERDLLELEVAVERRALRDRPDGEVDAGREEAEVRAARQDQALGAAADVEGLVDVVSDRVDREADGGVEADACRRVAEAEGDRHVELGSDAFVAHEDVPVRATDVEDRRVADVEAEVRHDDLDHAREIRPSRRLERDVCGERQPERAEYDVALRVEEVLRPAHRSTEGDVRQVARRNVDRPRREVDEVTRIVRAVDLDDEVRAGHRDAERVDELDSADGCAQRVVAERRSRPARDDRLHEREPEVDAAERKPDRAAGACRGVDGAVGVGHPVGAAKPDERVHVVRADLDHREIDRRRPKARHGQERVALLERERAADVDELADREGHVAGCLDERAGELESDRRARARRDGQASDAEAADVGEVDDAGAVAAVHFDLQVAHIERQRVEADELDRCRRR